MPGGEAVSVRPYEATDEQPVLDLLQAAFGRWPRRIEGVDARSFFRWKHTASPFGRSTLLIAELDDRPAGVLALMPWRLRFGARVRETMRGVDLAVDPRAQRRGVSMKLIAAAAERYPPEIALGWSNPNQNSRPGVLKSGRRRVGGLSRYVAPGATARGVLERAALHAGLATGHDAGLAGADAGAVLGDDALLSRVLATPAGGGSTSIATARDAAFLRWRYGAFGLYRALVAEDRRGRAGLAIFRAEAHRRFAVTQICELLVERDDARLARRLVRAVLRAASADFAVCAFPSPGVAALCGFVRARGTAMVAANPRHGDLEPDPTLPRSWASVGDLELI